MKIKLLFIALIAIVSSIFFKDFLIKGNLPIPSDTIVGLYYPFRDLYAKDYPRGIPFKNFLITDPVRQQYPWKNLAINAEKTLSIPLWNPYNFAGAPLLANLQSGPFYPLNLLFFLLSFPLAWSLFILAQPILAGIFLFLYLDNLKLDKKASFFGSFIFAFCGFSMAWLEWGNILSTALWLPLLFLASDKIIDNLNSRKNLFFWSTTCLVSLLFSFFAGHLQIFFYVFIVNIFYLLFKFIKKDNLKTIPVFASIYATFALISSFIWLPAFQLISLSARSIDQANWRGTGWFIPWQNLVQFISPDFLGNPSTLNYFATWNYGEFIGYVGIGALIFAFLAILVRREKQIFFFALVLFISLLFSLPNLISSIPYRLAIPFISTSQPTRLIFLIDFSLSILAAYGMDRFLNIKSKKQIIFILGIFAAIFAALWVFVLGGGYGLETSANILVSKRNLIFPSLIFLISAFLIVAYLFVKNKYSVKFSQGIILIIILVSVVDLFRLGWKYNSFSDPKYLYPNTNVISYLQKNAGNFRIMETDPQILPPNFSIMYKLQSVDGYDPLYLQRYAELIAAVGRGEPNINPPFGFFRIITPQNYLSPFTNLLGVKYILSLSDIKSDNLVKVFQEGQTRVYENKNVIDRAFFVQRTINAVDKQSEINLLYSNYPLASRATVSTDNKNFDRTWGVGSASIKAYMENKVEIQTSNQKEGFLILTDSFYPTWKAMIDGKDTKIYLTDYNFRGIIVPKGEHKIIFYDTLF